MKVSDKLLRIFVYLSLVVLGIIVGVAVKTYTKLPLAEEVNLVDVATLAVTIFLAVYIPAVLDRKLQVKRDKKELIIDRITDYMSLQRRINSVVQEHTSTPDYRLTINNLLDITRHRLETLGSLLKNAGFEVDFDKDVQKIKQLDDQHRSLLANAVRETKENLNYSPEIRDDEERLFNGLDEACSMLIFKIDDIE